MGYRLGIDLGTTYTAAAVWRDGNAAMVALGSRATSIPSVVFVDRDGTVTVGEPAAQRGRTEPEGLVREFKRRIGDPEPIRVQGLAFAPEHLQARLLAWVLAAVTEREGGPPETVVLTHPANWGDYRLEMLDEVARLAGLDRYERLSEPEAGALQYASLSRVEDGAVVAVYDLGGGTFDASVLRKVGDRFVLAARPGGIDKLGGIDFDDVVVGFVRRALGTELAGLDFDDPSILRELSRLRLDCVDAKEQLSSAPDAVVPVSVGPLRTQVRITRQELEALIEPQVMMTVEALERSIADAKTSPDQLRSVLLVGGSSRIPIIGRLITEALHRPVAVDAHPKEVVALGAATYAGLLDVAAVERSAAGEPLLVPPAHVDVPVPSRARPAAAGGFSGKDLARLAVVMLVVAGGIVGGFVALNGGLGSGFGGGTTIVTPPTTSTTAPTTSPDERRLQIAYLAYADHFLSWVPGKRSLEPLALVAACKAETEALTNLKHPSEERSAKAVIENGPLTIRATYFGYVNDIDTALVNCELAESTGLLCNDAQSIKTNYQNVLQSAKQAAPEEPFLARLPVDVTTC